MTFLIISFVAGVLTVLAPCVLPLLPVIIGGSLGDVRSKWKPYVITFSLTVSIILFTLLLKFASIFINIPQTFWAYLSGGILVLFGLITLFPHLWEKGALKLNLFIGRKSNTFLAEGVKKESFIGDIIIGVSLGPVFSSCSPIYFVILATVLPESFFNGLLYLASYSLGLASVLLLISKLGQRLVGRLDGVSDPYGWFKRSLGALFIVVGIFVFSGLDKKLQTYLIDQDIFDITKVEQNFLLKPFEESKKENMSSKNDTLNKEIKSDILSSITKKFKFDMYKEITNPAGFVNSDPFLLKDLVGKKVILLDVMTYSCINCQRTFPYVNAWYEKYKDDGLVIVGIHTPEFAFEKKKENVEDAMKKFGIKFPVVLDNDYGTWNAYGNNYWPRKYLIDIDGYVVYDHIGEGAYDETEQMIKKALEERSVRLGEASSLDGGNVSQSLKPRLVSAQTKETYFGAWRNSEFFGNGIASKKYLDTFTLPNEYIFNEFYLGGKWNIEEEYIESVDGAILAFNYDATEVYLVAESSEGTSIRIKNGGGADSSFLNIKSSSLYTIVKNNEAKRDTFYLFVPKGVRLYALTFS